MEKGLILKRINEAVKAVSFIALYRDSRVSARREPPHREFALSACH